MAFSGCQLMTNSHNIGYLFMMVQDLTKRVCKLKSQTLKIKSSYDTH